MKNRLLKLGFKNLKMKNITVVVCIFLLMYFVCAFIVGALDSSVWPALGRFCFIFLSFLGCAVYAIYLFIKNELKG
jgi:hypothetical protein